MSKLTLALLSGGDSSEREVSLNSGTQVYDALDKEKYDIVRYDPKTELPKLIADAGKIDAALIILHGPNGEDGTVQGLLDLLKIPYQGSGVLGSAVAMNKLTSKAAVRTNRGYRCRRMWRSTEQDTLSGIAVADRLGLPVVVKPVAAGSSVGMTIVRSAGGSGKSF